MIAVEPSEVMIAQRSSHSARAIQANAEHLPFADDSFDAAMAVITLHHWNDVEAGLAEMVRVARDRVVIVSFDPQLVSDQWMVRDHLPEALTLSSYPPIAQLLNALPAADVQPLPVPRDCTDRMFATLWARPEEHLDPRIRAATSTWHLVPQLAASRAINQLREDLRTGGWDERYGHLRAMPECDVGLRLIRAELRSLTREVGARLGRHTRARRADRWSSLAFNCVEAREIEPWDEDGQTWRRLAVTFPKTIANHNPTRSSYYDEEFMQRRMDYSPDVTGNPPVAHLHPRPQDLRRFRLSDAQAGPPSRRGRQGRSELCADHRRHPQRDGRARMIGRYANLYHWLLGDPYLMRGGTGRPLPD